MQFYKGIFFLFFIFLIANSGFGGNLISFTPKQIFIDQKRFSPRPENFPFIVHLKNCTAFIIDRVNQIAITAAHCNPTLSAAVCFESENLGTCKYSGKIEEILEESSAHELDYVIFRISMDSSVKNKITIDDIKLARQNYLPYLKQNSSDIYMLGYPADKYQQRNFTKSECKVKTSEILQEEIEADWEKVLSVWKNTPAFNEHPAYQEMRNACHFISDAEIRRPTFITDCSVYGGNSGGPVLYKDIVIGMPATYYQEPALFSKVPVKCFTKKYWGTFFRPILKKNPPFKYYQEHNNWDRLDRTSSNLSDFPKAIPMHLITKNSEFLLAHPEYLK